MLQPKKTKFRKMQKGRMKGNAQRGHQLAFGSFGIKALEETWITSRQIEDARIVAELAKEKREEEARQKAEKEKEEASKGKKKKGKKKK